jgi:hypothetical protein
VPCATALPAVAHADYPEGIRRIGAGSCRVIAIEPVVSPLRTAKAKKVQVVSGRSRVLPLVLKVASVTVIIE